MQSFETNPLSNVDLHKMFVNFSQSSPFRNKSVTYSQRSKIQKRPKHSSNLTFPLSTHGFSSSFPQELYENQKISSDEANYKAKQFISHIEDPLWKKVCTELINMMGPVSVLKVWNSTLGPLSPENKSIELACKAKEAAHFIQQYDFVILSILRRYFPTLNELRVEVIH